jgi:hypothetical protein
MLLDCCTIFPIKMFYYATSWFWTSSDAFCILIAFTLSLTSQFSELNIVHDSVLSYSFIKSLTGCTNQISTLFGQTKPSIQSRYSDTLVYTPANNENNIREHFRWQFMISPGISDPQLAPNEVTPTMWKIVFAPIVVLCCSGPESFSIVKKYKCNHRCFYLRYHPGKHPKPFRLLL